MQGSRPKEQRFCPHPACGKPIASVRFCCGKHWYTLSYEDRWRVNYAWTAWKQGYISLESLRKVQQDVTNKWRVPKSFD
jgi:hypothetical protein